MGLGVATGTRPCKTQHYGFLRKATTQSHVSLCRQFVFALHCAVHAIDTLIVAAVARPRCVCVKTASETSTVAESMTVIAHVNSAVPHDVSYSVRNHRNGGSALT